MMCPMLTGRNKCVGKVLCYKEKCAWWDDTYDEGKCCIFTITKNLNYVAEICEGTRTLFVREV